MNKDSQVETNIKEFPNLLDQRVGKEKIQPNPNLQTAENNKANLETISTTELADGLKRLRKGLPEPSNITAIPDLIEGFCSSFKGFYQPIKQALKATKKERKKNKYQIFITAKQLIICATLIYATNTSSLYLGKQQFQQIIKSKNQEIAQLKTKEETLEKQISDLTKQNQNFFFTFFKPQYSILNDSTIDEPDFPQTTISQEITNINTNLEHKKTKKNKKIKPLKTKNKKQENYLTLYNKKYTLNLTCFNKNSCPTLDYLKELLPKYQFVNNCTINNINYKISGNETIFGGPNGIDEKQTQIDMYNNKKTKIGKLELTLLEI